MKKKFFGKMLLALFLVFTLNFGFVSAVNPGNGGSSCGETEFCNPLEYEDVNVLVTDILDYLQGIIVVISIIFIVIGAILYITSAGNESRMTLAKGAIVAAMIGLAIGIAAPSFLKEIANILGWGQDLGDAEDALSISEILLNLLNFLLGIVGVLGIIMLVSSGIMYLFSAGDQTRIDMAKNMTKWSIIGIVVALASMVIVRQIAGFFA
ncbi:hypothetical protein ACFL2R_01935 [Patescibacteria group bacterium]